jgi:hypothetical protein
MTRRMPCSKVSDGQLVNGVESVDRADAGLQSGRRGAFPRLRADHSCPE